MELAADFRIVPEGAGYGVAFVVQQVKLHDASDRGDDDDLGGPIAENNGLPAVEGGTRDRDTGRETVFRRRRRVVARAPGGRRRADARGHQQKHESEPKAVHPHRS